MMEIDHFFTGCLFFNASAFSRQILKLAEIQFKPLKLSPSHASLLLIVFQTPGISPKELSHELRLTPSTITRLIDALVKKKLLRRQIKGKNTMIHPTGRSLKIKPDIARAYQNLFKSYTRILGMTPAMKLSNDLALAGKEMEAFLKPEIS